MCKKGPLGTRQGCVSRISGWAGAESHYCEQQLFQQRSSKEEALLHTGFSLPRGSAFGLERSQRGPRFPPGTEETDYPSDYRGHTAEQGKAASWSPCPAQQSQFKLGSAVLCCFCIYHRYKLRINVWIEN